MKSIFLSGALLSAVAAWPSGAAAQPAKGYRTVQVIVMGERPVAPIVARPADGGGTGDAEAVSPPSPPPSLPVGFQVHDLSRQWVQFQMANSLSAVPLGQPGAASSPDPEDPFREVGNADLGGQAPAYSPSEPAVAVNVPEWMRGGMGFTGATSRFVPGCNAGAYRPAGFLAADAELRRARYYGMMSDIACQYGIPVGLFDAMIIRESRYQPGVFSPKQAYGLTQLMPGTAARLGVNRYGVEDNLKGGAIYLRQQLDRFGQVHLALAAYNAGPGRVRNGLVPRIPETQAYVSDIIEYWRRLSGFSTLAIIRLEDQAGQVQPPPRPVGRQVLVMSF